MSSQSHKSTIIALIGQKGYPADFPGTSGIEVYVEHKIRQLVDRGYVVVCYTRSWTSQKKRKRDNIILCSLPTWNTKHFDTITYTFLATIHALFFMHADVFWYQGIAPGSFSILPKILGKKTMLTIHSLDWERKKWGILAQIILRLSERLSIVGSNEIYTVSRKIQQYIYAVYHRRVHLDRVTIPKQAKPGGRMVTRTLRRWHTKPKRYLLFIGRFVPEKRIEWLITAFQQVRPPHTQLLIAGGQSHTHNYERRIHGLCKTDRTIRLLGYIFDKEKSVLLAHAKLLILPSQTEGLPVVVEEALQYNTPCLIPNFLEGEYPSRASISYFDYQSYDDFYAKFKLLVLSKKS